MIPVFVHRLRLVFNELSEDRIDDLYGYIFI